MKFKYPVLSLCSGDSFCREVVVVIDILGYFWYFLVFEWGCEDSTVIRWNAAALGWWNNHELLVETGGIQMKSEYEIFINKTIEIFNKTQTKNKDGCQEFLYKMPLFFFPPLKIKKCKGEGYWCVDRFAIL